MAKKHDILYVNFYTGGSAAHKIELTPPQPRYPEPAVEPQAKPKQRTVVYVDPLALGVIELGIAGAMMTVIAFLTEQPVLPQTPAVWGSVLFLSICCTGVAFVVQSVAQQYTSATHVGLIFTLEPVFSGIVAYFVADERLLPRGYVGAALMLLSLVIMEMDWKKLKRK